MNAERSFLCSEVVRVKKEVYESKYISNRLAETINNFFYVGKKKIHKVMVMVRKLKQQFGNLMYRSDSDH